MPTGECKCDMPFREKVTIDSLIMECEERARRADNTKTYADGEMDAYLKMKYRLKLLKEDMELDK